MSARESMLVDVVIVGAGPAGLAAAIRLKQLNDALEVVVLDRLRRRGDGRGDGGHGCRRRRFT